MALDFVLTTDLPALLRGRVKHLLLFCHIFAAWSSVNLWKFVILECTEGGWEVLQVGSFLI